MSDIIDGYKELIEEKCGFQIKETIANSTGTGRICSGAGYETDKGRIFVKYNNSQNASTLFTGEFESLQVMKDTNTVHVPQPLKVVNTNTEASMLILEHLDMKKMTPSLMSQLGEQVARMHLYNQNMAEINIRQATSVHQQSHPAHVEKFGFHISTCYGNILQDNTWDTNWVDLFARSKLQHQVNLIEKQFGDRELLSVWPDVLQLLPKCFKDFTIQPALLHGDLHGSNIAQCKDIPVTFDPSSFYGHSEFDLSIADMFGGFPPEFWQSYHNIIHKQPMFEERKQFYDVYNLMNHWNHFGPIGYWNWRDKTLQCMKNIITTLQ